MSGGANIGEVLDDLQEDLALVLGSGMSEPHEAGTQHVMVPAL